MCFELGWPGEPPNAALPQPVLGMQPHTERVMGSTVDDSERTNRESVRAAAKKQAEKRKREVEKRKREVEEKAQEEANEKAKRAADEKAQREVAAKEIEVKAQKEAAVKAAAAKEADKKAQREVAAKEIEAKAQKEAAVKAAAAKKIEEKSQRKRAAKEVQSAAEEKVQREAAVKTAAAKEVEEKAQREAAAKEAQAAEDKAQREAAAKEVEEKAQREAAAKEAQAAEDKAQREAAAKEVEEKAQMEAAAKEAVEEERQGTVGAELQSTPSIPRTSSLRPWGEESREPSLWAQQLLLATTERQAIALVVAGRNSRTSADAHPLLEAVRIFTRMKATTAVWYTCSAVYGVLLCEEISAMKNSVTARGTTSLHEARRTAAQAVYYAGGVIVLCEALETFPNEAAVRCQALLALRMVLESLGPNLIQRIDTEELSRLYTTIEKVLHSRPDSDGEAVLLLLEEYHDSTRCTS